MRWISITTDEMRAGNAADITIAGVEVVVERTMTMIVITDDVTNTNLNLVTKKIDITMMIVAVVNHQLIRKGTQRRGTVKIRKRNIKRRRIKKIGIRKAVAITVEVNHHLQ